MRGFSDALLVAVSLFLATPVASAIAQIDPGAGDEAVAAYQCSDPEPLNPDCTHFGAFLNRDTRTYVYRGNVYHFEHRAVLNEIKMELAFATTVTAELHVAIHQKQPNGEYTRYLDLPDVVIPQAVGCGAPVPLVSHFYSTADIGVDPPMVPVIIEAGFDYAIAFAWKDKSITHGFGGPGYLVPFRAGQVLGLVFAAALPPDPNHPDPDPLVPDTFIPAFYEGVYSMELCFEPQKGACCRASDQQCHEVLESECTGVGDYWHGEYTLCAVTPCIFGACCTRCGQCLGGLNGYTEESCLAEDGANHWPGVSCPAVPADLCPTVTGACCQINGRCDEVCELLCNGVYHGDGTTCTPNPCKGACCISGFDCSERTPTNCATFSTRFRGLGTTCSTLTGANECGGACCFGNSSLSSCQFVSQRDFCAYDSFPVTAYRGDGTTCPQSPATCGVIDDYRACCLSDGTCINTPSATPTTCTGVGVYGDLDPDPSLLCGELPAGCTTVRACCLPDGDCAVLTNTACMNLGGSRPAGGPSACGVFTCATEACCFSDEGLCTQRTADACTAAGGVPGGNGTTCATPALVCPGIGACCLDNGDCFDNLSAIRCSDIGGDYEGDGSTCSPLPLDCDKRGACCAITGLCQLLTESQCNGPNGIGGEFKGVRVPCAGNTCPAGACCLPCGCETRTLLGCTDPGVFKGVNVTCTANPCVVGAFGQFFVEHCLKGPAQSVAPECDCYNLDRDGDVDLHDIARFFVDYSAP